MDTNSVTSNPYASMETYSETSSHHEADGFYARNFDEETSSLSSFHRRFSNGENKTNNYGHHIVKRDRKGYKPFNISFYETSMIPGNMIRDAVNGGFYSEYRVGTSAEDLFYTVAYSVGDTGSRNPCMLFFDSPSDYESLFRVTLSDKDIQKWKSKMMIEKNRRESLANTNNKTVVK
jgi:hypothetical protein